jgi:hypothetical protein
MFLIEMVEGKDVPPEVDTMFSHHGKTVGLLMRMLQSYFHMGKYIVLDSGFCVLKGILKLKEHGLYACALIKKRGSWPVGVPGNMIQRRFDRAEVNVGDVEAITGAMDGQEYFLWGMKEPDYVMRMMSAGGPLSANESCKTRQWKEGGVDKRATFQYTRPFDWHFKYCHAVDNHNNLRHALPSLEDTWMTKRWECRFFSFILAILEINAFLALRYFVFGKDTIEGCPILLVFRRRLGWQMINNPWLRQEEQEVAARGPPSPVHKLRRASAYPRKYENGNWKCDASQQYQQYFCLNKCKKQVRTYCVCDPTKWLCPDCLVHHVHQAERDLN